MKWSHTIAVGLVVATVVLFAANIKQRHLSKKSVCHINLLKIQVTKLRHYESGTNEVRESDIFGAYGLKPVCPSHGEYSAGKMVDDLPSCSVHLTPND